MEAALRPRATPHTLCGVRAEKEAVVAVPVVAGLLLLLLSSACGPGFSPLPRSHCSPSVCLTELEQALWPASQMAMYSGCCASVCPRLCWSWGLSAPKGRPAYYVHSFMLLWCRAWRTQHSSCYMQHLALHLAILSTQYSS